MQFIFKGDIFKGWTFFRYTHSLNIWLSHNLLGLVPSCFPILPFSFDCYALLFLASLKLTGQQVHLRFDRFIFKLHFEPMNKFLTDSVRQRILAVGCISLATDSVTFGTGQQTRATKDIIPYISGFMSFLTKPLIHLQDLGFHKNLFIFWIRCIAYTVCFTHALHHKEKH